jgi:hypothetical protein
MRWGSDPSFHSGARSAMGWFYSFLFGCSSLKNLKKKLTTVVVGPGELGKTGHF